MPSKLVIFDIDNTIIRPGRYKNPLELHNAFFQKNSLGNILKNSDCQVALASYNTYIPSTPFYCGKYLGRAILNLSHYDSEKVVPDEFIHTYMPENWRQVGKNLHIIGIVNAYKKRYGCEPKEIFLYDDDFNNIILAKAIGVKAIHVQNGFNKEMTNF